jgi:hypothetical protein
MSAKTVCDNCGSEVVRRQGRIKVEDQMVPNHWGWLDFCGYSCAMEYFADKDETGLAPRESA